MTAATLDPRPGLIVCENSGMQRLWCPMDCCGSFTMTQDEWNLYHGGVTTIRTLEQAAGRPLPQYRARYNTWRVPEPETTTCEHQADALCHTCDTLLDGLLADLPYLVHELGIAARKGHRFAPRGQARGQSAPCPVDGCKGQLQPTNETWKCAECRHEVEFESALPWNNGATACLRAIHLMQLEQRYNRPNLLTRLSTIAARGHRAIERPDNLLYLGDCPTCHQDIWAEHGEPVICECGYRTTWEAHHEHLLDQLEDRLLTVSEVVTLYQAAGQPINRQRVNNLILRRQIPTQQITTAHWGGSGMRTEPISVVRLGDFRCEHERKKAG